MDIYLLPSICSLLFLLCQKGKGFLFVGEGLKELVGGTSMESFLTDSLVVSLSGNAKSGFIRCLLGGFFLLGPEC